MANKMLFFVALFQTLIAMILADTCNVSFSTSDYPIDGPFSFDSGVCYSLNSNDGENVYSAWIDGTPSGKGYLQFFSDDGCHTPLIEGPSPVNFTGGTLGSVSVKSCT